MKIERFILGIISTNTYLLTIDDKCLVIDPASKPEKLIDIIGDRKLIGILLTHGHFDHIKAVDGLSKYYNCPVYIHKEDDTLARNPEQGRTFSISNTPHISVETTFVKEGETQIGPFKFETIYTPGHTKGSVCYRFKNNLFTGDTLFNLSAGRTDLDSGSDSDLKSSLRILKEIKENLNIYPGHEDTTTLDFEKDNNPFLKF